MVDESSPIRPWTEIFLRRSRSMRCSLRAAGTSPAGVPSGACRAWGCSFRRTLRPKREPPRPAASDWRALLAEVRAWPGDWSAWSPGTGPHRPPPQPSRPFASPQSRATTSAPASPMGCCSHADDAAGEGLCLQWLPPSMAQLQSGDPPLRQPTSSYAWELAIQESLSFSSWTAARPSGMPSAIEGLLERANGTPAPPGHGPSGRVGSRPDHSRRRTSSTPTLRGSPTRTENQSGIVAQVKSATRPISSHTARRSSALKPQMVKSRRDHLCEVLDGADSGTLAGW